MHIKTTHMIVILAALLLDGAILFVRYRNERRTHKKRKSEALYAMIMDNSLIAATMGVLLLAILLLCGFSLGIEELVDLKALVTIILSCIVGILLVTLRFYLINRLEDSIKLTKDYQGLISKYSAETGWYRCDNTGAAEENFSALKEEERETLRRSGNVVRFPVIRDSLLTGKEVWIRDSQEMYELPEEVRPYEADLFKAHETAHLYNQLNIRVTDWKETDGRFEIHTARTTYFKSMVTNRAIDFRLKSEMTVRDMLQYGPFVPSPAESRLSNHLGFNGFLITSDGKIPLVRRSSAMSIGKHTCGPSVGASLKAKYALDEKRNFSVKGLLEGIRREIMDELKLTEEQVRPLDETCLIAAYRDIVEGCKPQLLFCFASALTKEELEKQFRDALKEKAAKNKRSIEEEEKEDGRKLIWLDADRLDEYLYLQTDIVVRGERHSCVPSATVSLLMLRDFLKTRADDEK